jgi:hypothetical protein
MIKSTVGSINGLKYTLILDTLGNQQACDEEFKSSRYWFAWAPEYIGHFKTKKEAYKRLLQESEK